MDFSLFLYAFSSKEQLQQTQYESRKCSYPLICSRSSAYVETIFNMGTILRSLRKTVMCISDIRIDETLQCKNIPHYLHASSPAGACWDMLLVPYRDRMESLDRGFLAMSSVLVVLLLSLNKSRSPCPDPELAAPPAGPAAAEACVGVPATLLELT